MYVCMYVCMHAPALTPTNSNPSVWTQPDLLGDRCPNHHLIFWESSSAALGFSGVTVLENGWKNPLESSDVPIFFHKSNIFPKIFWLVVSTPLKNISQWEGLSHILWKKNHVPNHQPVFNSQVFWATFPGLPLEYGHQLISVAEAGHRTRRITACFYGVPRF